MNLFVQSVCANYLPVATSLLPRLWLVSEERLKPIISFGMLQKLGLDYWKQADISYT